jgi:hypothetical protein
MGLVKHTLFFARNAGTILVLVLLVLVFVNFIVSFHSEHAAVRQKLLDDKWLLEQCGKPDFYLNLKQHSDLCAEVERNARRNVLLHCIQAALKQTELCGFVSCTELAQNIMQAIVRGGIFTIAVAVGIVLCIPLLAVTLWRMLSESIAESHIKQRYNMPYGLNAALLNAEHEAAHTMRRRPTLRYEDLGDPAHLQSSTVYIQQP